MTQNSTPESPDEADPGDPGDGADPGDESNPGDELDPDGETPGSRDRGRDDDEPGADVDDEPEPGADVDGDPEPASDVDDDVEQHVDDELEPASDVDDDAEQHVDDELEPASDADDTDDDADADHTADADDTDDTADADHTADHTADTADTESAAQEPVPGPALEPGDDVPEDVRKYDRFQKMDGAQYERVNEFLRDRTYITAREWAIARLCADFRTETGVEMTKIGENLPRLVPFMTGTYSPQAVNQARSSFEDKVNKAGATFLYGAMSGFFTAEELDELMYEVTEVAKFLLEVEGVDLTVEEELEAEDRISEVMREVRESSAKVRGEEVKCPECGHVHDA